MVSELCLVPLLLMTSPPTEWRHAGTTLVSTIRYDYVINLVNYGPSYTVPAAEGVLDREQFIVGSPGGPDNWSAKFMPLQQEWASRSWDYQDHSLRLVTVPQVKSAGYASLESRNGHGSKGTSVSLRSSVIASGTTNLPHTFWGVFPLDVPE